MTWFNYYGLIYMAAIMVPNIIFAVKNKDSFKNLYNNKAAEIVEQVSRYACLFFMIFNIPYTYVGFYLSFGKAMYLIVNGLLALAYCLSWIFLWKKSGIVKAVLLSVIPSLIFLFSAALLASIPLAFFSVTFAVTHILISVKNVMCNDAAPKVKRNGAITACAIILSFVMAVVGTLGGATAYGQSSMKKLDAMSALDMINYDVTNKSAKISVALIENGQITYRVYGRDGLENATYDYEIGSISKTFVGLLCAKAVNEGKLKLTDSIANYLDLDGDRYYPTIERLLTHTSGYKAYYFEASMIGNKLSHITNDFYGISRAKILNRVKNVVLEDKDYPFVYSNFGISVVGLVLEKIYGNSFTDMMNDFIRDELQLNNTKVAKQSGNLDNYWKWGENDGYIPAGAIVSDIRDMASYLNMYLTGSLDYALNTFSKIKEVDANNPSHEKMNIRLDAMGMTWILDEQNGIVWHDGGTSNFNTYMGFTKDRQKGVVILSNLAPNDKISVTVIGAKILTSGDSL